MGKLHSLPLLFCSRRIRIYAEQKRKQHIDELLYVRNGHIREEFLHAAPDGAQRSAYAFLNSTRFSMRLLLSIS